MKLIQSLLLAALLIVTPIIANAQTVNYITPDAAAAGMSVVIDIVGPNNSGNFGPDGYYDFGQKVALKFPGDSIYAKLGPAVVSWDGKLIQVMMLVEHNVTPRNIALIVKNGAAESALFNFSVVNTTNIPPQNGGGTLGVNIGSRTRRGTMVVDSLILRNGTYTVGTVDPDLSIAGNQGYMPFRLLSKGIIKLENATISVRGRDGAQGSHGGAGGGGGGGGSLRSGGDGFSGGGGVGGGGGRKGGEGAGSVSGSKYFHGGNTPSGIEGGTGTEYGNANEGNDEGGGGGTGHPFGNSGYRGVYVQNSQPGGHGGGTGGGQGSGPPASVTFGGGGGGYATNGNKGGGNGNNGGQVVGNEMIVPFAGGSGGASGNIWYSSGPTGHGGGGGGAAEITSFKGLEIITSVVDAQGGRGSNGTGGGAFDFQHGSGGGGGSGGAIQLTARDSIHIRTTQSSSILDINGGARGDGYEPGGDGGKGRVRLDGRVSSVTGFNNTSQFYDPSKDYVGPVITKVLVNGNTLTINGYSKGWEGNSIDGVQIQYRFASTGWQTITVLATAEANSRTGAWTLNLTRTANIFDTTLYLIVMQRNINVASDQWIREPNWVMSHASGMIQDLPGIPKMVIVEDTIDFGKLRVSRCKDSLIVVKSIGSAQLDVGVATLQGDVAQFVVRTTDSLHLAPLTQSTIGAGFCPIDTGCFEARLRITSNDTERVILLKGCGILPEIFTLSDINFGPVRFGTCKDTTFTVSNPGSDTLTITQQIFTSASFTAVAPALPIRIAPKDSTQFTLRYCPSTTGAETGFDTIKSDARRADWPITLNGRGIRGSIIFNDTIDFGEVLVGSCKDSFMTITNTGDDTVFINDPPNLGAFFTVSPGQLPIALAPGSSTQLFIRFCPLDELPYIGSDRIRPLAPVASREVNVKGKGVKGLLTVPNAVDHACVIIGEVIIDTLVIENIGTGHAQEIVATASPAELTILRAPRTSLDPGVLDTMIVQFIPTQVGDFRGEIRISSKGLPDLQIPYTARVTVAPTLEFSRRVIDFDTVLEATTETECVTIMNPSCKSITITAAMLAMNEAAFEILPSALPVTLSDSATFEICIRANSLTSGIYLDTIVLQTDKGRFADVVLNARVETIKLKLEPLALDFGTVLEQQPPPSQQAWLINISSQPARIQTPVIVGPDANQFAFTGGTTILQPGDTTFYDVSYLASTAGNHTAYFVAYTGEKLDSVLLTGIALPNIDTIDAIVFADTAIVQPGDVIFFAVKTPTDLTGGKATTASFRVQFDPMRVNLGGTHIVNSIFTTATASKISHGDWIVNLSNPDTVKGSGPLVYLHMEILEATNNQVPVRLSEFTFPNSLVQVVELNDGLINVQECDTTMNIITGQLSEVNAIHPNPASKNTIIPVTLYREASVGITVYNALGMIVKSIAAETLQSGKHDVHLDLTGLPQSTYIYEVTVTDRQKLENHRGNLSVE